MFVDTLVNNLYFMPLYLFGNVNISLRINNHTDYSVKLFSKNTLTTVRYRRDSKVVKLSCTNKK